MGPGCRAPLHKSARLGGLLRKQFRLSTGPHPAASFLLDLTIPEGGGPFPVILRGDWCWRALADEIVRSAVARGYVLAEFNRVEIVPDNADRSTGLYATYPEGGFGAISAWAWGYHRCVDFLATLGFVDPTRIAVTGHSRGGKAALLAGATDERIALTAPNNSGCGGAGCYRFQASGSEDLAAILRTFPFWFGPRLAGFVGRVERLPFDQHSLKALVAPRAFLSTEALGDLWANPAGTWRTHAAAAEVWRFLGAESRAAIHYREGGHEHNAADWAVLLDFADEQLLGKPTRRELDPGPFAGLEPGFSWRAPGAPA